MTARWRVVVEVEDPGRCEGIVDTLTPAGPPTLRPGVVEIYKQATLIGYGSPDPANPNNVANWIMNDSNSYPVNLAVNEELKLKLITLVSETAVQLCTRAKNAGLTLPKIWRVSQSLLSQNNCPP